MESYWVNANKAGRKSWIKFVANSGILVPITPKYLKCKETWELKLQNIYTNSKGIPPKLNKV